MHCNNIIRILLAMIKAAFFDLDGTLVNSIGGLRASMNLVMRKFNCDEISEEQTRQYVGNGYRKFTESSLKATADRLYAKAAKLEHKDADKAMELEMQADDVLASLDDACEEYMRVYAVHYLDNSAPYNGMRETLDSLKSRGIKLACITNKPKVPTDKTLREAFGEGYFDYVVCDDGIVPRKPDPTGCLNAMKALGVEKDEVIYAGDTKTDMQTAVNAGLKAVGCLYGFRDEKELRENGADYLIREPLELLPIVEKLS